MLWTESSIVQLGRKLFEIARILRPSAAEQSGVLNTRNPGSDAHRSPSAGARWAEPVMSFSCLAIIRSDRAIK